MSDTVEVTLKGGVVETREVLERHGQWLVTKCLPVPPLLWSEAFGYTVTHVSGKALVAGLERIGAGRVAVECDRVCPPGADPHAIEGELRAIIAEAIEAFDVLGNRFKVGS